MSKWISVKTKPIPSGCYFLAFTKEGEVEIVFRTSDYECLVRHSLYYGVDVKDITHWRPLPEPPEN